MVVLQAAQPFAADTNFIDFTVEFGVKNRYAIIGVHQEGSALGLPSLSWGGQGGSHIAESNVGSGADEIRIDLFGFNDAQIAAVGAHQLLVSNVVATRSIHCIAYKGVDQTTPIEIDAGTEDTTDSSTPNPLLGSGANSVDGNVVLAFSATGSAGTASWANVTEVTDVIANGTSAASMAHRFVTQTVFVSPQCTWSAQNRAVIYSIELLAAAPDPVVPIGPRSPGRAARVHLAPVSAGRGFAYMTTAYLSDEQVPGMVAVGEIRQPCELAARGLSKDLGKRDEVVTAVIGDHTEELTISHSAGGAIQQWRTAKSGAYDVKHVNRYGITGRLDQSTIFTSIFSDSPATGNNPTQAGSNYDGHEANDPTFSDGYIFADAYQGAPSETKITDLGGGQLLITTDTNSFEWDTDGSFFGSDPFGSPLDPATYRDLRMHHDTWINWTGRAGVHRDRASFINPTRINNADGLIWPATGLRTRLGWDEIIGYRASTYTRMDNNNIVDALSSPTITSVSAVADLVTVTFAAPHGRNGGTVHNVVMAGWSGGGASINGTRFCTFSTGSTCTFVVTGASGTYTGGTLNSGAVKHADLDDRHSRVHESGATRITVGGNGPIVSDQTGTFREELLFGSGRNAMIFRATGTRPNSMANDFALALYVNNIGEEADLKFLSFVTTVPRAAGLAYNSEYAADGINMVAAHKWTSNFEGAVMEAGEEGQSVAFIITGSYSEVQGHISWLDGQPDSIFDY